LKLLRFTELKYSFLRSKVARRIFFLFVVCALIPLSALAYFSFSQVTEELYLQANSRLRQACKASSMSIIEHLSFLENDLGMIGSNIHKGKPGLLQSPDRKFRDSLRERFKGLVLITDNRQITPIFGKIQILPLLRKDEIEHVHSGNTLFTTRPGADKFASIFVVKALGSSQSPRALLLGEINPEYLWNEGTLSPTAEIVVLDKSDNVLFSSSPGYSPLNEIKNAMHKNSALGQFTWTLGGNIYIASYRTIFMRPQFYNNWILVQSESSDDIITPTSSFKKIFMLLIILTFLVVLFLSLSQIRRSLIPIEMLQEATRRIAANDFGNPVQIRTNDEFEELGSSFNKMASSLENHLQTMTMLNKQLRLEITERKRAEEDKDKLQAQLLQAQKMEAIGQLAGGVAHDFNNVLTAIVGYGNLLLMRIDKNSPLKNYVDHMLTASDRAAKLVSSLLAFSRKQITNPEPVDVNSIINELKPLITRLIGEDVELKTLLTDQDLTVMADANQMDQVLMNLATNARDAMPNGGLLSIGTEFTEINNEFIMFHGYGEVGKYALITVSDTGVGVDEETKARIFEPFFTTKDVDKGTGLGLAMVYGIIKRHKGYISVYSELSKGTTFRIYLPLIQSQVNEKKPETVSVMRTGTETILLVEDNAAVRGVANAILTGAGYKVLEAVDGEDAIHKFVENKDVIHLVILDVIMPKKNGKEVYEAIKKVEPDVKIIFTSGYTADIIQRKGIVEEGSDLVLKPFSPHVLLEKMRNVLDRQNKSHRVN
jgi:signal transduction histidine kinase